MSETKLNNLFNKKVLLKIVDDEKKANFITHSGTFHADEVMATVILLNYFDEIKLCRTNNVSNKKALIYDISPSIYDHHDISFNKTRDNGIKYASCGLIWEAFGKEIIKKLGVKNVDDFFKSVDKTLIMDIDRDDNGQSLNVTLPVKIQSIPNLISYFNPSWDSNDDENDKFLEAVSFANTIFNNIIKKMISNLNAKKIVNEKIKESKDGILILDRYMPWKDVVLTNEDELSKKILCAVFPSKRGGYNVVATPKELNSFEVKKPFPKEWAGKEKENLRKISKIKTINFCHKGLFLCSCDTFDDAIKIANILVEGKESINE